MFAMEVSIPAGAQPVLPQPERTPVAIRAAVARLDPAALARFEEDWVATMTRAREEYSVLPVRQLVEHWWLWVAVTRWPALAGRLRECEQIVARSGDRQPDKWTRRVPAIQSNVDIEKATYTNSVGSVELKGVSGTTHLFRAQLA